MPMIRSVGVLPKSIWIGVILRAPGMPAVGGRSSIFQRLLYLTYQIPNVLPPIQNPPDLIEYRPIRIPIVRGELREQFPIHFLQHGAEFPPRRLELRPRSLNFFERHIQLEHLFQQLRGNVARFLLADIESALFQQIFRARNRLLQGPVSIVESRGGVFGSAALILAGAREPVRMPLLAERIETRLQFLAIQSQLMWESEEI